MITTNWAAATNLVQVRAVFRTTRYMAAATLHPSVCIRIRGRANLPANVIPRQAQLENRLLRNYKGSLCPSSLSCWRRCLASGIAFDIKSQKFTEWLRWVR